jgi:antibiotic biosynthesis monooxygenase (ABM) superfamily enzyme
MDTANSEVIEPVTIVVRRRARRGAEADFERAMREFVAFALTFPGNRGIDVLRPQPVTSREYTVVGRFDDWNARDAFKDATDYRAWMARLRELSEDDPYVEERAGLGGWFTPPDSQCPRPPARIKMAVVTLLGVYPLTSTFPALGAWLLPTWHPLPLSVVVTGAVVASLTWVVMPILTRLFARWLFAPRAA